MAPGSWRGGWGCPTARRGVLRLEAARRAGRLRKRQFAEHGAAGGRQLHAARLRLAGRRAGQFASRNSCWTPTSWACCTIWPRGVDMSENGQAMDAIREVGPGGHYLGCAHTQANFKSAFWRTEVLDYKPFETWAEEGARDSATLANVAGAEADRRLSGAGARPRHRRGAGGIRRRRRRPSMPDAFV